MLAVEYGTDALIIDAGLMFPAEDMHGIDYIIPDFSYLQTRPDLTVRAILVTHGHEDHTGAIAHVAEKIHAPVYATPLTCGLIEVKLRAARMRERVRLVQFRAGDSLSFGPFTIEPFHVCHSIPDSVGFGIQTPVGLIVHSGDFKFDQTPVDNCPPDYAKLASFAERGTLALFSDSTNADHPGWTPSERVIDDAFDRAFREAPGRIIVATFASLISRIQQVADAATRHRRKLAITGRGMIDNVRMAVQLGYLTLPPGLQVSVDEATRLPPNEVVFMATGAQGEPSAALNRLATGKHTHLSIHPGDTVILSAHAIPGNEESVYRTINRLFQRGANVIYGPLSPVHVSGHASQEEQKLLISLVRPRYFIPVHGEPRHLRQHAHLAEQVGIPHERIAIVENGTPVQFDHAGCMTLGERIPGGYVFVDGGSVGEVTFGIVHERESLARRGVVLVSVAVDRATNRVIGTPQIATRGAITTRESEALLEQLQETVRKVIEATPPNGTTDDARTKRQTQVQEALARLIREQTHRRPIVYVAIGEVAFPIP